AGTLGGGALFLLAGNQTRSDAEVAVAPVYVVGTFRNDGLCIGRAVRKQVRDGDQYAVQHDDAAEVHVWSDEHWIGDRSIFLRWLGGFCLRRGLAVSAAGIHERRASWMDRNA